MSVITTSNAKPQKQRRAKKPPLAPLSTGFMENTKPVQRVQDAEKSECSGVDPLSQITPWLYLGSHRDALDSSMLASHGIDCVLNTAKECDTEWADSSSSCGDSSGSETPEGWRRHPITYLKLHWTDHADESISQEFPAAFKFIEAARQQGRKVLVHCRRGISRSATLVIAYLMQYVSYGLDDAFSHVRSKRAIINPNLGFVLSLETFARQLGQEPKHENFLTLAGHGDSSDESHSTDTCPSSPAPDADMHPLHLAFSPTLLVGSLEA